MRQVIILRGLPASGKTSYAVDMMDKMPDTYKRVNRDSLRSMVDGGVYSKGNEKIIKAIRDSLIFRYLDAGRSVFVDDTNLHSSNEEHIRKIVADYNILREVKHDVLVVVREFPTDVFDAIDRDALRTGSAHVGSKVIYDMYSRFLKKDEPHDYPEPPGTVELVDGLPKAIICDLDGTMAFLKGRNPYDASTCENDTYNAILGEILHVMDKQGYQIIFLSGRSEKYLSETRQFLKANLPFPHWKMFMRPLFEHNIRDSILKRKLYDEHVKDKYNVFCVFDDRDQVVGLWRKDLGLQCFQVNYGNF
ncbi:MAG: AAA family ATPase [Candidatus Scalindua sp.]|jgi:predicted kinase|nr:AAA family ATPase [Candidatus Scalindua sp.]